MMHRRPGPTGRDAAAAGRTPSLKRLIVTADDFGLSIPVNEAVEEAHRRGILTAASLMVAAPAAEDAIARARRMPRLGVGLHLVIVDGRPVLSPEAIPDLVEADGTLSRDLFRRGAAIYFRPTTRRQMEAELRAQFEAFRRTGLALDHVNAHHHFHLHPKVASLIARLAREFGVRAVRVPFEPPLRSWRATGEGFPRRLMGALFYLPAAAALHRRLRAAGIAANDVVFGVNDSGQMTRARILGFLEALLPGTSEIYCHPARRGETRGPGPTGSHPSVAEFEALVDPEVIAAVRGLGIELIPFAALTPDR